MHHAGFWIRVAAALIDGIIFLLANFLAQALMIPVVARRRPVPATLILLVSVLLAQALGACYEGLFVYRYAATPGKLALRLRVLRPDGARLSLVRAVGRFYARLLSALPLFLGYLLVAFDTQKRGLHDILCDTRVVRVGP